MSLVKSIGKQKVNLDFNKDFITGSFIEIKQITKKNSKIKALQKLTTEQFVEFQKT